MPTYLYMLKAWTFQVDFSLIPLCLVSLQKILEARLAELEDRNSQLLNELANTVRLMAWLMAA